jgi:hypothetical protein
VSVICIVRFRQLGLWSNELNRELLLTDARSRRTQSASRHAAAKRTKPPRMHEEYIPRSTGEFRRVELRLPIISPEVASAATELN